MVADNLLEDVPHLGILPLEHLLRALDRVGVAELLEATNDKRLVELQRDLLGKAALMEPERRANDDHAPRRIVDTLAKEVLAEAALLPLDHVGKALERAIARGEHRPLAAVVVKQGVDGLLQHPLLVADDDFGRVEIDQLLEAVVAVDDPAVEVVEIACGEIARIEHHQRPQVRGDDRNDVENHPLGLVLAVTDRLDDLEAIDEVLLFLLRAGRVELLAELLGEADEIEQEEELAHRLGPHLGIESGVAIVAPRLAVLLLGEELLALQRRVLRVENDVILKVDHLFQARRLHVEQRAQTARHRLEEPNMDDRRCQFDVAHALAADAAVGDLHAAAVADHPLVLHPAVLSAGALPVLLRSEDLLAHQAVLFGTVRAVVDRLGLLHLAKRPALDVMGPSQADLHGGIVVDAIVGGFTDAHETAPWKDPDGLLRVALRSPGSDAVGKTGTGG